jgi:Uma2 family endonuclease
MTSSTTTASPGPYTWDDFVGLGEDDPRELIDGELVEVEVPTFNHERAVARLVVELGKWSDSGHGGEAIASGYKVRVSARSGVMPDVQFYRAGNIPGADQANGLVQGRADLVVEIVSPSSRRYDRVKKLNWYASLGVPEYWVVDPELRLVERLVLRDDGMYAIAASLTDDEVLCPESFAGLEIQLARLWG